MSAFAPQVVDLVIPIYNEEESIPALINRLELLQQSVEHYQFLVVFVDDHSQDNSAALLKAACQTHENYSYLRLSHNRGSHIAILAGLANAVGECAVFLAADLQDPPELIHQMLDLWQQGNHVVWAARERREGISRADRFLSNLTWSLLNRFGGAQLPPEGTDFALVDRVIIDALNHHVSANPSIIMEIAQLGFQQAQINYTKEARRYGVTKWNLEKKLKAFADAFISTSYMPLRFMSYLGLLSSALGFLYAIVIVLLRLFINNPVEGWSALMVVILVFGGLQMIMLGVIGEYLWRTLEQARNRPLYHIEEQVQVKGQGGSPGEISGG